MQVVKKSERNVALWAGLALFAVVVVVAFIVIRPLLLDREADRELLKEPAFQQIARWEPSAYAQMKASMIASMQRHEPAAQAQGRVRAVVAALAKKYMQTASDDALIDYMRVIVEEIRQTNEKDPDAAYAMVFKADSSIDMTKYIDPQLQKRDEAALAEIIHTGVAKEAGYQNNPKAIQLVQQIAASMREQYGRDFDRAFSSGRLPDPSEYTYRDEAGRRQVDLRAMSAAMAQPVDKRRTCEMMVEFYNRVLALRSDRAAQVVRYLLSKA